MNKNARGLSFYLIAVMLIMILLMTFRGGLEATQTWNTSEYAEALAADEIVKVEITPNQEVPTGTLKLILQDGDVKYVNMLDVQEAEDELKAYDV